MSAHVVRNIMDRDEGRCPYTREQIFDLSTQKSLWHSSLDRITDSGSYTFENAQFVCSEINTRYKLPVDWFEDVWVYFLLHYMQSRRSFLVSRGLFDLLSTPSNPAYIALQARLTVKVQMALMADKRTHKPPAPEGDKLTVEHWMDSLLQIPLCTTSGLPCSVGVVTGTGHCAFKGLDFSPGTYNQHNF